LFSHRFPPTDFHTTLLRRRHPGTRALADQRPLELGERTHDVKIPGARRGDVDVLLPRFEPALQMPNGTVRKSDSIAFMLANLILFIPGMGALLGVGVGILLTALLVSSSPASH
jgi:hypothetical protein